MRFPQVVVVLGSVLVGAAVVSPGAGAGLVTRQDKRDARYLISGNGFIDVAVAAADGRGMEIKHKFKAEGNPSWVLFDKKTNTVFSVDENNAQVQRHTIDLDAPNIQLTKSANSSSGPVHLALLDDRNRLLSASFTNGTVDVWDVAGDDLKLVKTVALRGNLSPNKERQASRHAHQVIPEPVGRFVAVTDLGTDIITMIDTKDDNFNIVSETTIDEAGCGPRHGAFFPPGQGPATHLMVLCEMKNSIHVLPLERSGDRLGLLKGLKIPSFGSRSQNASSAAGEIVISPDGSFIYVTNRLMTEQTDHIARFTVKRSVGAGAANGATNGAGKGAANEASKGAANGAANGAAKDPCPRSVATAGGGGSESSAITLEFSDEFSTQGKAPRMMSFGLDGKQMFVNSNGAIGMLGLDIAADGSLTPVEESSLAYSIFSSKPDSGPQFVQQIR